MAHSIAQQDTAEHTVRYAIRVPELSVAERWLPVVGYPDYQVSDQGRVRSIDRTVINRLGIRRRLTGRILKQIPHPGRAGRLHVSLYRDATPAVREVAYLVLEAFAGPRPSKVDCCHDNGNPTDNRAANLYWGTRSQNMYDRVRHGNDPHRNQVCCRWGHMLKAPNLVACKVLLGHRNCLACSRARGNVQRARERGVLMDFRTRADWHYERITGTCRQSSLSFSSSGPP